MALERVGQGFRGSEPSSALPDPLSVLTGSGARVNSDIYASGAQCLHYWQPFPPVSSTFPRAVHVHQPPYGACVCKRGVGPCARYRGRGAPGLSNARRPTRFARPVPARRARPGPRSPSLAAISHSSEGSSGPHHADKTNFCGGERVLGFSRSATTLRY